MGVSAWLITLQASENMFYVYIYWYISDIWVNWSLLHSDCSSSRPNSTTSLNRPGSRRPPATPRPSSAASSSSSCSSSAAPRSCRSWSVCVWRRRLRPPSAAPSPPAHTNRFRRSAWGWWLSQMWWVCVELLGFNSDLLFLQLLFLLSCPFLFLLLLLLPLLFLFRVCRHIRQHWYWILQRLYKLQNKTAFKAFLSNNLKWNQSWFGLAGPFWDECDKTLL